MSPLLPLTNPPSRLSCKVRFGGRPSGACPEATGIRRLRRRLRIGFRVARTMGIILKTGKQIETIRRSGQAATATLQRMGEAVKPGIATSELDRIARKMIRDFGGTSSFLGYRPSYHPPFPATICASINDEIVHGIPSPRRKIEEGDILSLDFAMIIDGYHGDTAFTFPVGRVSPEAQRLLDVTRKIGIQGDRGSEAGKPHRRHRARGAAIRGVPTDTRWCGDLCGTRDRPQPVGRTAGPQSRQAATRHPAQTGHGHRHRAHGVRGRAPDPGPRRRMDDLHRRRTAVRPFRTHGSDPVRRSPRS